MRVVLFDHDDESFNGRLSDELLNGIIPTSLTHVRTAFAIWKDDYNAVRPNSALGNLPPAVFPDLCVPGMPVSVQSRCRQTDCAIDSCHK